MDEAFLQSLRVEKSQKEILWEVTRDNLATLPPEVEDVAYRCAIVRWFDAEIIKAIQGGGHLRQLGRSWPEGEPADSRSLYEQLQKLPFVEEFPGRGHTFHELTRRTVLSSLWRDEHEFYREVSTQAADFFGRDLATEEGANWDEVVEWSYHMLIADEADAIDRIDGILTDLGEKGYFNYCHALVQVAEEHAAEGELSPETVPLVRFWRIQVTQMMGNFEKAIQLASELRSSDDVTVPPGIKAAATECMAASLTSLEKYDEAYDCYVEALKYERFRSPEKTAQVLKGMGEVSYARDEFDQARACYAEALTVYVPTLLYSATFDQPQAAEETALVPGLKILDPNAWYRLQIAAPNKESEPANGSPTNGESTDDASQTIYVIEGSTEEADSTGKSEQEIPLSGVEITTTLAYLWLRLGELFHYQDHYGDAAACGRIAAQMFEDLGSNYGILRALRLLRALGQGAGEFELTQSAVESEEEVLRIARLQGDRPTELEALLNLAGDYATYSKYDSSRKHFAEARELALSMEDIVGQANAFDGIAGLDFDAANYSAAAKGYKDALDLYRQADYRGGQARALLGLGDVERMRNKASDAAEHYRAALDLLAEIKSPSEQCHALRGLGLALMAEGHYAEAIKEFEAALAQTRKLNILSLETVILSDLAEAYRVRKDVKNARKLYEQVLTLTLKLDRPAMSAEARLALGDFAVDQGEFAEAIDYYQQARQLYLDLKRPADEFSALIGLLNVHRKSAKLHDFIQTTDEAHELAQSLEDPDQRLRALVRLVESLRYHDQYDMLWSILDETLTLQPESLLALRTKADILADSGEFEQAICVLDQAINVDPNDGASFASKGWALERLGVEKAHEAYQAYQAAIELNAKDPWLRKGLANALRLLGENDNAAAQYRWAITEAENSELKDASTLGLMSWCHYNLGEYDKAVRKLTEAQRIDPENMSNQFDLALVTLLSGDPEKGLQEYRLGIEKGNARHRLPRRGFLYVALTDLISAITAQPELAKMKEVQKAQRMLETALAQARGDAKG